MPGEQAVLEHFGKPVGHALTPGAHFKLPWPVDKIYRYRTDQIQSFDVGYTPDAQSESERRFCGPCAYQGGEFSRRQPRSRRRLQMTTPARTTR